MHTNIHHKAITVLNIFNIDNRHNNNNYFDVRNILRNWIFTYKKTLRKGRFFNR